MGRSCRLQFALNGGSCIPCLRSSPQILVSNGNKLLQISFSERGLSLDEREIPFFLEAHGICSAWPAAGFAEFVAGVEDISGFFCEPTAAGRPEDVWIRTSTGVEKVEQVVLEAIQGDVSLRMVIGHLGSSFLARHSHSSCSFFIAHKELGQLAFSEDEVRLCSNGARNRAV
jgi:hypothetical protein